MTYGRDCQLDNEEKPKDRSSELIDSISIAAFDVDGRIFRTVWHSLVRAPDVARDALAGDYTRYIAPIRLFVALFGLQFVIANLFDTPLTGSLEQLTPTLEPERINAWLATGQMPDGTAVTTADIDRAMEEWGSLFLWPITIISSLPYLLTLKLYRPSIPLWLVHRFYSRSTTGTVLRILGLLALVPLALLITTVLQLLVTAWTFDHEFNLSFAELMQLL